MKKTQRRNRPTLQDIAREAGVSSATVSYVLNGTGSISPAVQKRVRETARAIGYRVNHMARATRTGQTLSIGLILPDLSNPFFPELAQAVQSAARDAGYAVFLVDSEGAIETEHDSADDLIRRGVEGIVWCPASEHDSLAEFRGDVPIVVVDRPLPHYDTISSDHYSGGALVADQVLALGHRHVALVAGPQALSRARQRRQGFVERIGDRATIDWVVENPFAITLSEATQAKLHDNEATVIVCGNDFIALGVMRALHELGRRVPEDVSVVGFDDILWARHAIPGLATVRQPLTALGKEASALLIRRIAGDDAPYVNMSLATEVIVRGSLHEPN
ncbi:MAG: LacI family DNA-binding transcriptional regulator [Alphaproteobacteria bacterium]